MKIKPGKILVSTPELLMDHIFNQSIILLTEHNERESMGFILNKPIALRLHDVFPDIPLNIQLWNGGPVDTNNMFFIHNVPHLLSQSIPINTHSNLYLGGDFDIVKKLLLDTTIDGRNIKFFLGYSGWSANQLEVEIKEKAWLVNKVNFDIFNLNPRNIWKEKIVEINPENIIWKNAPLNPNLN